jgi:hypothetical protein
MAGDYGPPLSGDLVVSSDKLLANDNAAANTRAKNNSKHYIGISGGAINCLRKGKAIFSILVPPKSMPIRILRPFCSN